MTTKTRSTVSDTANDAALYAQTAARVALENGATPEQAHAAYQDAYATACGLVTDVAVSTVTPHGGRRRGFLSRFTGVFMLVTTVAAVVLSATAAQGVEAHGAPHGRTSAHPVSSTSCRAGVWPKTAEGYASLWSRIDESQWGAADGNLSVKLGDGRVAWFYGDTFSTANGGRFVHSTAIVQTGSCLHVANKGAQIVPNVDDRHIFWIDTVTAKGASGVTIKARAVTITDPGNVWGFADGGYWQTFTGTFDRAGNITVKPSGGRVYGTAADQGPMLALGGEGHFGYGIRFHRWAKLASGEVLTSVNQNWADGQVHPFAEYRPIWSETDGDTASVVAMYQ